MPCCFPIPGSRPATARPSAVGWGHWGERPYTDLLVAIDGALERPDLDPARTALIGGSFGGYMANWVAGNTDRSGDRHPRSLWELRGFHGTTDYGTGGSTSSATRTWTRRATRRHRRSRPRQDPHADAGHPRRADPACRSPRRPAWTDLMRHGVDAKFLYFPDENHWVLKPQNGRIWVRDRPGFLDHHVLEREWLRPSAPLTLVQARGAPALRATPHRIAGSAPRVPSTQRPDGGADHPHDRAILPEDTRAIAPEHEPYNAPLVRRVDHTDDLATSGSSSTASRRTSSRAST